MPLPLREGSTGEAVRDLQRRLAASNHDIGDDEAGVYGPGTAAAVRAFQDRRGLRVDAVCGVQTWNSLVEAGHHLGDRLLYLRSPMLRGDDVADLQRLLGELGFDAGRVDGIFGPDTAAALVEFQRNIGLPTDGILGPDSHLALRRVAGPAAGGATIAALREAERLRATHGLHDQRLAVGDGGGVPALADALGRALGDAGARTTVLHHPDESARAAAANAFDAIAYLGVAARAEPGVTLAYYGHETFESKGGRHLAECVATHLDRILDRPTDAPRAMRVPALRETRMPAVLVDIGPPSLVVRRLPALVRSLADGISDWAANPTDHQP